VFSSSHLPVCFSFSSLYTYSSFFHPSNLCIYQVSIILSVALSLVTHMSAVCTFASMFARLLLPRLRLFLYSRLLMSGYLPPSGFSPSGGWKPANLTSANIRINAISVVPRCSETDVHRANTDVRWVGFHLLLSVRPFKSLMSVCRVYAGS
jgi:hypothetical protein